jgi:4-amino-4-deoxy-L-arabinose transferase-like glycosyltransferase
LINKRTNLPIETSGLFASISQPRPRGYCAAVPDRFTELKLPAWVVVTLWLLALPVLIAGLGQPVVQRTQEARVLETAREMVTSPDRRQWLVPRLNDEVRLQKPPLAYWAAAGAFELLGVSEFAGRLPFALAGWLTLAVVYRFGKALVDQRFGLLSAGILLTSYMFFRHFRLAETDALAALFVTASVYWMWHGTRAVDMSRAVVFFHLAAAAIGLAVLAKGPPGAFPLLFLIAWAAIERRWTALRRFLVSGALLTAVAIGASWFFLIRSTPEARILLTEVRVVTAGEQHPGPFYVYVPQLFVIPAPWTGLYVLGLIWAILHWRAQPAMRVVLTWGAVIFIPLCFVGNKQNHYLVPLTPAVAMVAAYAVHRGLGADPGERRAVAWVLAITLVVALASPVAVVWVARHQRGGVQHLDVALCVILLAGAVAAISLGRRNGIAAAVAGMAAAVAIAFAVTFGRWLPSLEPVNHRTVAAELRARYGEGPYAFYGPNESMPLVWNLRSIIREAPTPDELAAVLRDAPGTVVIAQVKNNRQPPPLPAGLTERERLETGSEGNTLRIYRAAND